MDGHGVMTCCRGDGPVALWMPRGASAITLALAAMEVRRVWGVSMRQHPNQF